MSYNTRNLACLHIEASVPRDIYPLAIKLFERRGIPIELASGKAGLASYGRVRIRFEAEDVDSIQLCGQIDRSLSDTLAQCAGFDVILSRELIVVSSVREEDFPCALIDELLGLPITPLVGYALNMDHSLGPTYYAFGVVYQGRMGWSRECASRIGAWSRYLSMHRAGEKLREVYPCNVFRPRSILVGNAFLEDWVMDKHPASLSFHVGKGVFLMRFDIPALVRIRAEIEALGVVAAAGM